MKKINSNSYGGKIIGIGFIPLFLISGILWEIHKLFKFKVFLILMNISIGVGLAIEIVFSIYLMIELHQDKRIEKFYEENPDSEMSPQDILERKQKSI